MQSQYIDLPLNISETPEQIIDPSLPAYSVPNDAGEAAHQILVKLDGKLKSSQNELYIFYENSLTLTHRTHFSQKEEWPESNSLECID